jgi:hypothetical protein
MIRLTEIGTITWAVHIELIRDMINSYKTLDGKPDKKLHSERSDLEIIFQIIYGLLSQNRFQWGVVLNKAIKV